MTENIIKFPERAGTRGVITGQPSVRVSDELGIEAPPLERETTIDDLYPAKEVFPILAYAQQLLGQAVTHLDAAKESESRFAADDAVMQFQDLLPELFCCRSLADGYAAIVIAVFHSLKNLNGAPLTQQQIIEMRWSMIKLQKEPFMKFDDALALILGLENSGLEVDPAYLEPIQAELIEESVDQEERRGR